MAMYGIGVPSCRGNCVRRYKPISAMSRMVPEIERLGRNHQSRRSVISLFVPKITHHQ